MLGSRTESCGKNDRYVIEMARHLVREFDHNYEIVGLAATLALIDTMRNCQKVAKYALKSGVMACGSL